MNRAELYQRALACPHTIEHDQVVLRYDPKQPGKNALAQLADRLGAPRIPTLPDADFWMSPAQEFENLAPVELLHGTPLPHGEANLNPSQEWLLALPLAERVVLVSALLAEEPKSKREPQLASTRDRLTDLKANSIVGNNGYRMTGHILTHDSKGKCLVDLSAVRWLQLDEFWSLMHPEPSGHATTNVTDTEMAVSQERTVDMREALTEARDAMSVMSNWVQKSDPAAHSWGVRMVDRASAALNGNGAEPLAIVASAPRAPLASHRRPRPASSWQHHSGAVYTVFGVTSEPDAHKAEEFPVTVFYLASDGRLWSRKLASFLKSFTLLRDAPPDCAAPGQTQVPGEPHFPMDMRTASGPELLTALAASASEIEPTCWCQRCLKDHAAQADAFPLVAMRMILCPTCGNKRCPHASDHTLECTASNEPGQPGSVYA